MMPDLTPETSACTCPAPGLDERYCAFRSSGRPEVVLRDGRWVCLCRCHDGKRTPEGAWPVFRPVAAG